MSVLKFIKSYEAELKKNGLKDFKIWQCKRNKRVIFFSQKDFNPGFYFTKAEQELWNKFCDCFETCLENSDHQYDLHKF